MMNLFRQRRRAFTLVETMIIVAIIGILLMIALPGWIHARQRSQRTICMENLTKIDHAKEVWAFENSKKVEDGVGPEESDLYGKENYLRDIPKCPADGTYTINAVGTPPTCSLAEKSQHFIEN